MLPSDNEDHGFGEVLWFYFVIFFALAFLSFLVGVVIWILVTYLQQGHVDTRDGLADTPESDELECYNMVRLVDNNKNLREAACNLLTSSKCASTSE